MDLISISLGNGNRFVISITREPDWVARDETGKIIAEAHTERGLKKKLKKLGMEIK